jgi:hypothetical protein
MTAYGQIADLMPRFDRLGMALIDKPDFQQALAVVYSDILEFHKHSYKFFRRNGENFRQGLCIHESNDHQVGYVSSGRHGASLKEDSTAFWTA